MWVCERSCIALAPSSGRNKQMQALLTGDGMNMNIFSGENYICYKCNYKYNINLTYLYSYQLLCRKNDPLREHNALLWNKIHTSSHFRLWYSYFAFKTERYECTSEVCIKTFSFLTEQNLLEAFSVTRFHFKMNSATLLVLFFLVPSVHL